MKINDEIQIANDESMTNDEARNVTFRHSGFVILSSFVIRASSFLLLAVFPRAVQAADNISILGSKPKWSVLEHYQETITRDEFAHLINDVYCTHGLAPDLIEINEKTARILTNRESQKFFTLRFAENDTLCKPVPRLWRGANSLPRANPKKPLSDLRIALDAAVRGLAVAPLRLIGRTHWDAAERFDHLDTAADSIGLTARELEVLSLLGEGASNKEIARRLAISVHTAKFHVASILDKLDATGRTDAVAHAIRLGLLML